MSDRAIVINDAERHLLLASLAGFFARTGDPAEVTACMQLAQRIEGFTIDGREGSSLVRSQGGES